MSTVDIRLSFERRLKAWATAQSPEVKVAYQNKAFVKPSDGSLFLECFLIPNDTLSRGVAAVNKTYLGMFQVNVWAPKNQGMRDAEVMAESISNLFPVVPKLTTTSVESPPKIGNPVSDDSGWVVLPILINYRFET